MPCELLHPYKRHICSQCSTPVLQTQFFDSAQPSRGLFQHKVLGVEGSILGDPTAFGFLARGAGAAGLCSLVCVASSRSHCAKTVLYIYIDSFWDRIHVRGERQHSDEGTGFELGRHSQLTYYPPFSVFNRGLIRFMPHGFHPFPPESCGSSMESHDVLWLEPRFPNKSLSFDRVKMYPGGNARLRPDITQ